MGILSHRIYGVGNTPIYILHGIFGMKDNWHYVAGELGKSQTVITVDARNHGKSFHSFEMSYSIMAEDLAGLMEHLGHTSAIIMGHSMGGKTAMKFAEMFPEKVQNLIVVDIATKAYPAGHLPYFQAFESLDFSNMQSRTEADAAFMPFASDPGVRQFLLKNLEPLSGGGYQPRFNLPAIKSFYNESIGTLNLPNNAYTGPVLFISGSESNYLKKEDHTDLVRIFPNCQFKTVQGAGHWVHADNPGEFLTILKQFLTQ